ncbi:hypothetical protein EJP617_11730 [Erwinia sp. Ejp617]|nr:hypothetical protein EJP617_11730 [Erwinia sp. Ejp617]
MIVGTIYVQEKARIAEKKPLIAVVLAFEKRDARKKIK